MLTLFPAMQSHPRFLFVDMNAFFASVEQQECELYRDRPIIVVPVLADSTCAIAASYEARKKGIKTGISVKLARLACPDLQIVEARPRLYLEYHARLVAILQSCFDEVKVLSVDEMACRLPQHCRNIHDEERLALWLKQRIARDLGPSLRCSIGVGPNIFLAKIASEARKPDGLTLFYEENLPEALFDLQLTDLPGIGSAMRRRLAECGILTVEALWNASLFDLRRAWRGVLGERWYYMLRGSQELDYQVAYQRKGGRKSVGHSNVLAPEHRSLEGAKTILLELLAKALRRLRAYNQAAGAVKITVTYRRTWGTNSADARASNFRSAWQQQSRKHLHANDEETWLKVIVPLMATMQDFTPSAEPGFVSIVFSDLLSCQDVNLSLFEDVPMRMRLALMADEMSRQPGGVAGGAHSGQEGRIPLRIPFGAPDALLPAPAHTDIGAPYTAQ